MTTGRKLLLAISSWPPSMTNGDHAASRATWLRQDLGIDCRFFIGDGTPALPSDLLDRLWNERLPHYHNKAGESRLVHLEPQADEVVLRVPWDFKHLALKVREVVRWAYDQGYDHLFKVDTDTYVDIPRLLASGFEAHDYAGHPFPRDGWMQASGGAGYWLSRRAMEVLKDAPVTNIYEDTWVGEVLCASGIRLHPDERYRVCFPRHFEEGPRPANNRITSHLGFSPEPFESRFMHMAHRLRQDDGEVVIW